MIEAGDKIEVINRDSNRFGEVGKVLNVGNGIHYVIKFKDGVSLYRADNVRKVK